MILLLVILPLLAAAVMLLPVKVFDERHAAWRYALTSTLVTLAISLVVAWRFDWTGTFAANTALAGQIDWVPGFGLSFSYAVDAISMWLVLLTTLLMPITILGSLTAMNERFREFYFWLLVLQAAMTGTFIASDIIFFYVCFEFTLVPLYFLIGVFGSERRLHAAKVFFLYTFTGSMLTFAGVLYVAWFNATAVSGAWTFDIAMLTHAAQQMSGSQQALVLGALLAGFAVKVPLFPVHTWLPLAHTEAPTAGSVILAGVLLKLGTYGMLRFALPMAPEAVVTYAPYIGAFAVAGILYGALVCWVQKDVKKLVAYSSVSHLGFCVLGMFALDPDQIGAVGSVMYMINHGFSTGALFLCIGMIYERFHTREMAQMSGLARVMPVWAFFTMFFVMASVGLPGLNGFIGEFMTLLGAFMSPGNVLGWEFAAVAGLGMIFAAMYLLYLSGKVVFGPLKVPHVDPAWESDQHLPGGVKGHRPRDLNLREIITLTPLAVGCLVIGLGPYPMLKTLEQPVAALTEPAERVALQRLEADTATVLRDVNSSVSVEISRQVPRGSREDAASVGVARRTADGQRLDALMRTPNP